jgi:hypothetical protein
MFATLVRVLSPSGLTMEDVPALGRGFAGNAPFCTSCGTLLNLPDTNNIECDGCGRHYLYQGASRRACRMTLSLPHTAAHML